MSLRNVLITIANEASKTNTATLVKNCAKGGALAGGIYLGTVEGIKQGKNAFKEEWKSKEDTDIASRFLTATATGVCKGGGSAAANGVVGAVGGATLGLGVAGAIRLSMLAFTFFGPLKTGLPSSMAVLGTTLQEKSNTPSLKK
jgi:hypothetical protein